MLLSLLGAEGGIVFQSPRAIEKSLTALGTALASSHVQSKSLRLRLVGHVPRPRPVLGFPCWASFTRLFRPIKKPLAGLFYLAEKAGFEPAVGYEPTHAFQACDLNHSSTSPDTKPPF